MTDLPDTLPFCEYGPVVPPDDTGPYGRREPVGREAPAGPQRDRTTASPLRPAIAYRIRGERPRIAPAARVAILYAYMGNHRPTDIAREHGINIWTVYHFAAKACLPTQRKRKPASSEQDICAEKRAAILADHIAGHQQKTIAKRHDVSQQFVSKLVNKAGLSRPAQRNASGRFAQQRHQSPQGD